MKYDFNKSLNQNFIAAELDNFTYPIGFGCMNIEAMVKTIELLPGEGNKARIKVIHWDNYSYKHEGPIFTDVNIEDTWLEYERLNLKDCLLEAGIDKFIGDFSVDDDSVIVQTKLVESMRVEIPNGFRLDAFYAQDGSIRIRITTNEGPEGKVDPLGTFPFYLDEPLWIDTLPEGEYILTNESGEEEKNYPEYRQFITNEYDLSKDPDLIWKTHPDLHPK